MATPPLKTELADTYPNPSNATFRTGIGKLYDYVTGLLGATGNASDARAALEAVGTSGDETIAGVKTFSDGILVKSDGVDRIKVNADGGVNLHGAAFSAYMSAVQALAAATLTKLNFNTEAFDMGGCFNNTSAAATLNGLSVPAYAFKPNVAGYYQINAALYCGNLATPVFVSIYKNGVEEARGVQTASGSSQNNSAVTKLIYLNGTSDYVDVYGYTVSAQSTNNNSAWTYFQGHLVRAA